MAVVPFNRRDRVKTRLAPTRVDRAELASQLLGKVITALLGCDRFEEIWVVSPEAEMAAVVGELGACFLLQRGEGLNQALEEAREHVKSDALLVVLGDLPFLSSEEVSQLVDRGSRPGVVIAPDRDSMGTNALLCRPSAALPFHFGIDSFRAHREAAAERSLALEVFRSRGTAYDIDTPEQLEEYLWTAQ